MLRFFKNIRKTLSPKYLQYAIGEIVLVVVGILIALQVNNWSENGKLNRQETTYLEKFSEEVEDMLKVYSDVRFADPLYIEESKEVVRYVQSCKQTDYGDSILTIALITHQTLPPFSSLHSTFDEMVATGAMARLKNEALKSGINNLYFNISNAKESIDYFREDLGRASDIIWRLVSFGINQDGETEVSFNYNSLCSNELFRNALMEVVDSRQDYSFFAKVIYESLTAVKGLLEEHLN